MPSEAKTFYDETKRQHISIVTAAIETIKKKYPGGLPNSDIRAPEESLMEGPDGGS